MRTRLLAAAVAAAVVSLLCAPLPRAAATGAALTVTSSASIKASAAIHEHVGEAFPLVSQTKTGPTAADFTNYDETLDARAEQAVPGVGLLRAASHVQHTTTILSGTESVTVSSSGSISGETSKDPALELDELLGAGGETNFQVQIVAMCPVSFTVSGTTTVTGPSPGLSTVGFADGREEDARSAQARIDLGVKKTADSFSHSGRLDGSAARPAFISFGVSVRGGSGSPFTTGRATWTAQLTVGPAAAAGDVYRWVQKKGGSYDTGGNWDLKKVPDDNDTDRNDTALFDLPGGYTVNLAGAPVAVKAGTSHRAERLLVKRGSPRFLNGQVVAGSASQNEPSVAVEGGAVLTLDGATLMSRDAIIGSTAAPTGTSSQVRVVSNSTWENSASMRVGTEISPGALAIAPGCSVTSGSTRVFGRAASSTPSRVDVTGTGAAWRPGALTIDGGAGGTSTVTVADGASATMGGATIGTSGGAAEVVVTATGDTVALPTVSAKGPKRLKERSKKPAFATIQRTGSTALPLTVTYVLEGTAESGFDHTLLPGTVTIPTRKRLVKLPIAAIDDFDAEGDETIRLSVVAGAGYSRSLRPTAQCPLRDND